MRNGKLIIFLALCTIVLLSLSAAYAETPLFTKSIRLSAGAAETTFNVYATGEEWPDGDGEQIYRAEYKKPDGSTAAFTFPTLAIMEEPPMLHFVDLNSDGYVDVEILRVSGATNTYSTYFINTGADTAFYEAPILSSLSAYEVYAKQHLILNHEHNSAATGIYTLYRWPAGAKLPYVYRVASFMEDERDNYTTIRDFAAEYDENGTETILLDENCPIDFNEADWDKRYKRQWNLLWQGLDSTENPLTQYLYVNPNGGKHYHTDSQCKSISQKYWPQMVFIGRGELFSSPYDKLTPCKTCCAGE